MFKPALAVVVSLLFAATAAQGRQDARSKSVSSDDHYTFTQMTPTPEMWMYSQSMKLQSDPKYCVRQNAAYDAAQRRSRIASREWYGISLSRPLNGCNPMMDQYGQQMGSNTRDPMVWAAGMTVPVYINPPTRTVSTSYGLW